MEAVLNWIREFLIIYFVLSILMHLAASDPYKKYLRFYSGIILLLVLISPLLRLSGSSAKLDALVSYETFWKQLESVRQDTSRLEYVKNSRYLQKYEEAVSEEIKTRAAQQGILVRRVSAELTDDYEISSVTVWLDLKEGQDEDAQREKLTAFLKNTYHLDKARILIG